MARKAIQVELPAGFFARLLDAVEADPRPVLQIERDANVSNAWLQRLIKQARDARASGGEPAERPQLSLAHVNAVARALGVRLEWLVEGAGPVRREAPGAGDEYPARQRAIEAATALGYAPGAVDAVRRRTPEGAERFRPQDWLKLIELEVALADGRPAGDPVEPEPEAPEATTERKRPARA